MNKLELRSSIPEGVEFFLSEYMENSVYCYRAVKRVPGGVVRTSGLASEAVFFSDISNRPYDCMCVQNIYLYGFMERLYSYINFNYQA